MRPLHNIVSRIFFPKIDKFDRFTKKDIAFMCYMVQDKPMNLPFMMLEHIKETTKRSRACLPCGTVFTLIYTKLE